MAGVETFRQTLTETCKPELLPEYTAISRVIERSVFDAAAPPLMTVEDEREGNFPYYLLLPQAIDEAKDFDPNSPLVKVAMLLGAASFRTFPGKYYLNENMTFEDVWRRRDLQSLAAECDKIMEEMTPKLQSSYVSIDLAEMHKRFNDDIKIGIPENIVVTGLNAAGKTKAIAYLEGYLEMLGLKTKTIKMPRPDGPVSEVILPALKGDKKIKPDAQQLFFIGDALDLESSPDTLMIFDRHPRTEAFVYGPEEIERVVLSTHELFKGVYRTFIISRHPMAAQISVADRERAPRIFEKNVDAMVEQVIRFIKLTALPGVCWITNDIPPRKGFPNFQIIVAADKFVSSVVNSGVITRHMIRQRLAKNPEEAVEISIKKHHEYRRLVFGV